MARFAYRSHPVRARRPVLALAAALALSTVTLAGGTARAQQSGYGQTLGTSPQERQIYDGGPGGKGDTILDATNPIDLMNRIRRNTAMEDATPPGSAIDQALRDYEAQSAPAKPAGSGASRGVSGI